MTFSLNAQTSEAPSPNGHVPWAARRFHLVSIYAILSGLLMMVLAGLFFLDSAGATTAGLWIALPVILALVPVGAGNLAGGVAGLQRRQWSRRFLIGTFALGCLIDV